MKKLTAFIICLSLALGSTASALSNTAVYYNGDKQNDTINVLEIDDTVLIAMRPIWDLAGYKLTWDGMRQRITTATCIGKLKIQIGSKLVSINPDVCEAKLLMTYPRIYEGQTMIPIDFAAECIDASIQYSDKNNTLTIITE